MAASILAAGERVCLVDDLNRETGSCLKAEVHRFHTPLHRGFSVFIFNDNFQLFLQQRAFGKPTWPGIWSNSCCGHPAPGETSADAAHRRLREELNLAGGSLHEALPDFRYRSRYLGVEENEFCPVFVGRASSAGSVHPDEINAVGWMDWGQFLALCDSPPNPQLGELSPWSVMEARLLSRRPGIFDSILPDLIPFKPLY